MKTTEPIIPLWEEIFEKVAREYVKDVSEIIPKALEEAKHDTDTYEKLSTLFGKYWVERNIWSMPLRFRTRFSRLVILNRYYDDKRGFVIEWWLGKEYHRLQKKL